MLNMNMIKVQLNYIIHSDGKVWSQISNKFLKPWLSKSGYQLIRFADSNKTHTIHRLVAESFIPNPNRLAYVNHKDGNKLNNDFNNLEWISATDNNLHAYSTGLTPVGQENVHSILTEKEVLEIRKVYVSGHPNYGCGPLGRKYNTTESNIRKIVKRKSWKHLA